MRLIGNFLVYAHNEHNFGVDSAIEPECDSDTLGKIGRIAVIVVAVALD